MVAFSCLTGEKHGLSAVVPRYSDGRCSNEEVVLGEKCLETRTYYYLGWPGTPSLQCSSVLSLQ
jgi:hypothetical protein